MNSLELRAGGTDLSERRRSGVARGAVRDIARVEGIDQIAWQPDGGVRIGALVTLATIATDPAVRDAYPGLAAAAGGLATPQIRRIATIGGSLLQRTRCWYYRHPAPSCFKKGGDTCPAREGNHRFGVIFDRGPCVAPHPSTMAMALLAYDATIETDVGAGRSAATLYGDGSDPTRDHLLGDGELLTAVTLGPPAAGEQAAYFRAISRTHAEWPLVEALARLVITDGTITLARIAVGGVAPVPLALPAVEAALVGGPPSEDCLTQAIAHATTGAAPLPMTGYKVPLLVATVREALGRAIAER